MGERRTPISALPFTISAGGSYYLTGNLTSAGGDGITVTAGNVTIDLNGFAMLGAVGGRGITFAEYLADTNPRDGADRLRITNFNRTLVGLIHQDADLTWTSNPSRCYRIEYRDNLVSGTWLDVGSTFTAMGATTNVVITELEVPQRFYRIAAQKPLSP